MFQTSSLKSKFCCVKLCENRKKCFLVITNPDYSKQIIPVCYNRVLLKLSHLWQRIWEWKLHKFSYLFHNNLPIDWTLHIIFYLILYHQMPKTCQIHNKLVFVYHSVQFVLKLTTIFRLVKSILIGIFNCTKTY